MPGYAVHIVEVEVAGHVYKIRALADKQQFYDPDSTAELAGISSATWSIFGVLWPAGRVLAERMAALEVTGLRILEVGCGLGLSSLVLQRRGADITASDHHPLADEFLRANAQLNGLPPVPFVQAQWLGPNPDLGRFDVIVGSDVLYERDHVKMLAAFLERHAKAQAQILITDPGRNYANALTRDLAVQGYGLTEQRLRFEEMESPPFRGRLLHYRR